MQYRPEVDGLRAVAVVAVLLFHAEYALFSGGYVGVDVFFVISGYLITSIIANEARQGKFSIARFYERRIRRIFPALFAVILATAAAAYLYFPPVPFVDFSQSVAASTLFSSNMLFWHEAGYFDAPAATKPLLHTWSLSVEEQFYIFYPLLLVFFIRRLGGRWWMPLAVLAALSLGASEWQAATAPSNAFYWAPLRAWELLIGAFLTLPSATAPTGRWLREGLSALGMALIGYSIFAYTEQTVFPGFTALAPCVGTALVMYACNGPQQPMTGRVLALKPVVAIGLISYSLYLWHWPILSVARAYKWQGLTTVDTLALLVASVVAGVLSWRFVEQPFRRKGVIESRSRLFAAALAVMVAFTGFGLAGHWSRGWPSRLPDLAGFLPESQVEPVFCGVNAPDANCLFGDPATPRLALWGDSHSARVTAAIAGAANREGFALRQYSTPACLPIPGVVRSPGCENRNRRAVEAILEDDSIVAVVLVARWSLVIDGPLPGDGSAQLYEIGGEDGRALSPSEQKELYARGFRASVDRIVQSGKRVILTYPIPEPGFQVPGVLAVEAIRGHDPAAVCIKFDAYLRRNKWVRDLFDEVAKDPLIIPVDSVAAFCDAEKCIVSLDSRALYTDHHHLSPSGAELLAKLFEPAFAQLKTR